MKKFNLSIQAVEDRTAPVMFTERNLPGFCCCSCCCCCCGSGGNVGGTAMEQSFNYEAVSLINGLSGANSTLIDHATIDWNTINWGNVEFIEMP